MAIGLIGIRGRRRREADCWSWARGVRRFVTRREDAGPTRKAMGHFVTSCRFEESRVLGASHLLHIRQPMKITVHRQACCPQDDQCGPLEAEYSIEPDASFSSLIQEIIKAGFLQFSSTHDRLSGEVDNKWLVEISSPYGPSVRQPEFAVASDARVAVCSMTRFCLFAFGMFDALLSAQPGELRR